MQRFDTMGSLLVDSVKITLKFRSYRLCDDDSETSMDVATAQQEAEKILAELPDRSATSSNRSRRTCRGRLQSGRYRVVNHFSAPHP